ncbi:MAG: helix-turn-helix domain-containing protein [Acidobacteriota bacterium]|nr:helix-turn-helix domain-containing protein [Acidobacteriota bacterium]
MKIGQRLRRGLDRAGMTQREVADRADLEEATVSNILNGKTANPFFATVDKILRATGLTWGELFDEPQMRLSETDARVAREFSGVLERVLDNDARQKRISRARITAVHDAPNDRGGSRYDEVEELPDEEIPEAYQRIHANRVYRVRTDAMQILEGSLLYARASQHEEAADGETVVCRLNGKLYLRRLDRRNGRTMLEATNPRYSPIRIDLKNDRFALVAVIRTFEA